MTADQWSPTRIRWVDRVLETSTGSARVETNLGPAYVKMMGNPEGSQALFCDWVGTRAAAWLELPTFDIASVNVTEAGLVTYANGTTSHVGPAFAAREESGRVRIPVPGTGGLAIELSPRGWKPKTGSTGSLFTQDLSGKRHLRLDLGFNKVSQVHEWHWNQKGTAANFRITNHTSVGVGEQILGRGAKVYKFSGRTLVVLGVAVDAYSIVTSTQPSDEASKWFRGGRGQRLGARFSEQAAQPREPSRLPESGLRSEGFSVARSAASSATSPESGRLDACTTGGKACCSLKVVPEPSTSFQGGGGHSRGYGASGSW